MNDIVGPHHNGVLSVIKMKHLHEFCPTCMNYMEPQELFTVNVAVFWKKISDIHIACCRRCLEKIKDCSTGLVG